MVKAELARMDYEAEGRDPDESLERVTVEARVAHRRYVDALTRATEAARRADALDPRKRPGEAKNAPWQSARDR